MWFVLSFTGFDVEIDEEADHVGGNHKLCVGINNLDFELQLFKHLIETLLCLIELTAAQVDRALIKQIYYLEWDGRILSQASCKVIELDLAWSVNRGRSFWSEAIKGLSRLSSHAISFCKVLNDLEPRLLIGLKVSQDAVTNLDDVVVIVSHQV